MHRVHAKLVTKMIESAERKMQEAKNLVAEDRQTEAYDKLCDVNREIDRAAETVLRRSS